MKRVKDLMLSSLFVTAFLLPVAAQAAAVSVSDAAVGTQVENRALVGASSQFDRSVGKLYAYTRIVGAEDGTQVAHRWYFGDDLMAEVTLPVAGDDWRTWSSKNLMSGWIGQWRVDVVAEDGTVLDSIAFQVR